MAKLKFIIRFCPPQREVIAAALSESGFDSFEEEGEASFRLYLEEQDASERIKSNIKLFVERAAESWPHVSYELSEFEDSDWQTEWKKHWQPIQISDSLVICPAHCEYSLRGDEVVVQLDTTYAFGTGNHPSTQLCLKLIEIVIKDSQPQSFLDIGCGSGVLSIAAAKLGVEKVYGVDIDAEACVQAQANALYNNLESIVFSDQPLRDWEVSCELVCANILSSVIRELWPSILQTSTSGGHIILSGILEDECAELCSALNIAPIKVITHEGWAAILCVRE